MVPQRGDVKASTASVMFMFGATIDPKFGRAQAKGKSSQLTAC